MININFDTLSIIIYGLILFTFLPQIHLVVIFVIMYVVNLIN